jgi:hypothetical protein
VESRSSAGPKGPSGRACSSLADSGSSARMVPASQTKKGADALGGETVSKGRRVTSRAVLSAIIAGILLRVVERWLVVPSCWFGQGRIMIQLYLCRMTRMSPGLADHVRCREFRGISHDIHPQERGRIAHIHTACAKFVVPTEQAGVKNDYYSLPSSTQ